MYKKWMSARRLSGAAMLVLGLVFLSGTASARIIPECVPAPLMELSGDPEAESWKTRICDAKDAVIDEWEPRLQALDLARQDMATAINAGDYDHFRTLWNDALPTLKMLEATALENRAVAGAADVLSLYRENVSYLLQNAGLGTAGDLDTFSETMLDGLNGPRADAAGTAAINLIQQSVTRSVAMVQGLAELSQEPILAERRELREQRAAELREMERGTTWKGYFGGLTGRFWTALTTYAILLLLACLIGAHIGVKRRVNPVASATALGLSFMIPNTVLFLLIVFLPFLMPTISAFYVWLAVAILATYLMYGTGGLILAPVVRAVGPESALGLRLRWYVDFLSNLRNSTGGAPANLGAAAAGATGEVSHGSARWGTPAELIEKGHLAQPGQAAGLPLARVQDAPAGFDQRFRHNGHVVTVAPTGSGKGIGQVIPALLEYPGSALVIDVKGENAAVTARARRALGQAVHVVDPFGVNGQASAAFNVLDRLDVANPDCVSESAILAESLVIAETKGEAVHFDESAKVFLQGLLLHVAGLEDGRRNLGELRRLLTQGEDALFELFADMAADETAAYGIPARAVNTVMGMGDKERGSVLSTARRNTAFLDDPRIAAALSRSDFDLSAIKSERMTVYLVMPANRIAPNARFLRLFIGSVISAVTASPKPPAQPVAFLLDEFGQLGYMKAIEDAVSLLRGYGLAFWVFVQDLSQLKGVYPRWQTFLANAGKVFFGTDDYDTAKYVSDSLGKATVEFETASTGRNTGSGASGGGVSMNRGRNTGTNQQFTGRELLTPDEVMRLGPERPLVLIRGENPYLLHRFDYLTDPEYAGLADPNPYHDR